MSNSDKEVLEEFETWRAELIGNGADLSVAAFLKERENDHNRLRIADALHELDINFPDFDREMEGRELSEMEGRMLNLLQSIHDTLVGDREYVEDRSLDGKLIRREYV